MTHLETLVRILPRQRRAYRSQRAQGTGITVFFLIMAILRALLYPTAPATMIDILGWLCMGAAILLGAYRATVADIHLTNVEATLDAVTDAILELAEARKAAEHYSPSQALRSTEERVLLRISADTTKMAHEIRLALPEAYRPVNHGR